MVGASYDEVHTTAGGQPAVVSVVAGDALAAPNASISSRLGWRHPVLWPRMLFVFMAVQVAAAADQDMPTFTGGAQTSPPLVMYPAGSPAVGKAAVTTPALTALVARAVVPLTVKKFCVTPVKV